MDFETDVVRGRSKPDPTTGAIIPPVYQTATYVLEEIGRDKGFDSPDLQIRLGKISRSILPLSREGGSLFRSLVAWLVPTVACSY